MGPYFIRRLLIAIPSILGISVVLFTVLALAPGDPFEELATNPAVPPEVRATLRAKFGLDDPIILRYLRWLFAMLQGDWGFSFVSRVNVDQLILQRLPTTHHCHRHLADIGAGDRHSGRRLCGDAALLDLRPDRQHLRVHRLLAAALLHWPLVHSRLQHRPRLAALRLPRRHQRHRLALVLGAHTSDDHARLGAGAVPGGVDDALRALRRARRDPPRLCDDGARQGARAARRHRQARGAQRPYPSGDAWWRCRFRPSSAAPS